MRKAPITNDNKSAEKKMVLAPREDADADDDDADDDVDDVAWIISGEDAGWYKKTPPFMGRIDAALYPTSGKQKIFEY